MGDDVFGKWIDVNDRLPEPGNKPVLVWETELSYPALAVFRDNQWIVFPVYDGWYISENRVTHWMPLPDLPQGAEKQREFDEYEIYYFDELIAEVKDYRQGFDSIIYGLSTDTQVVKKSSRDG